MIFFPAERFFVLIRIIAEYIINTVPAKYRKLFIGTFSIPTPIAFPKLKNPWNITAISRLPFVLLYAHAIMKRRAISMMKNIGNDMLLWAVPGMNHNGRCHIAQSIPRIRLALNGENFD